MKSTPTYRLTAITAEGTSLSSGRGTGLEAAINYLNRFALGDPTVVGNKTPFAAILLEVDPLTGVATPIHSWSAGGDFTPVAVEEEAPANEAD
jgi:hypothetical protein